MDPSEPPHSFLFLFRFFFFFWNLKSKVFYILDFGILLKYLIRSYWCDEIVFGRYWCRLNTIQTTIIWSMALSLSLSLLLFFFSFNCFEFIFLYFYNIFFMMMIYNCTPQSFERARIFNSFNFNGKLWGNFDNFFLIELYSKCFQSCSRFILFQKFAM